MHSLKQVVITGAGLVTALGLSRRACWEALKRGENGIGPLSVQEQATSPPSEGGQAPDLPNTSFDSIPREVAYLRHVLHESLDDAGLDCDMPYKPERCGVIIGTTLAGMRSAGAFLRTEDPDFMRSFLAASTLRQMTNRFQFSGFSATTCSACSSSLASIGLALSLLQSDTLDLVVTGGYDTICEYTGAGFRSLRLVSDRPPVPFSIRRDGMKLGESYALLILEREESAQARGATILARVTGYGESSDAHHLTQPQPEGDGIARAMHEALRQSQLTPSEIGLISAHATSTPDNDAAESKALRQVFGPTLANVPIVALKSCLGHTLGGAGAAELILTSMALQEQIHPQTLNVNESDLEFPDLAINFGPSRARSIANTLHLSLGFGGANSCVILSPQELESSGKLTASVGTSYTDREVFISGVGILAPGMIGNRDFIERLNADRSDPLTTFTGVLPDEAMLALIDARRTRRMSPYVKLLLAATALACEDASIADVPDFADSCGALLGTTHVSPDYMEQYYGQIVREGMAAANPMLFAEGVPNVGAAQISLMLGLRGPAQTIIGSRTAGLDAVHLASLRIRRGEWERAIVGAADEYSETVNRLYGHCGQYDPSGNGVPFGAPTGFVTGAGAAVLILESERSLTQRGIAPRGRIDRTATAYDAGNGLAVRTIQSLLETLNHPRHIMSCANATRLDTDEYSAFRAVAATKGNEPIVISSIYGHLAETFSVMPVAGIVAGLLTGSLPRFTGSPFPTSHRLLTSAGHDAMESFAVLVRDQFGPICGAHISILDRVGIG